MRFCIKSDALRDPADPECNGANSNAGVDKIRAFLARLSSISCPTTHSCCNFATWAPNLRISSFGSSTSICCGKRLLCGGSDTLLAASSRNRLQSLANRQHATLVLCLHASLSGWASGLSSPRTFNAASRSSTLARASAARSSGLRRGWGAATLARPCGARGPVGCLSGVRPRWPPRFLDEVVARLGFAPCCHAPGGCLGPLRIVLHMACDKLSSKHPLPVPAHCLS